MDRARTQLWERALQGLAGEAKRRDAGQAGAKLPDCYTDDGSLERCGSA